MAAQIVHLATSHRPGDSRIFQKECRTLAAAGYDVVYIVPGIGDSTSDGVTVKTVPVPKSGKERMTTSVRSVYKKAIQMPADSIFHLHDSDLLGAGFRLKRNGRRVVYDAHEDTPKQMLYQHWIPKVLRPTVSSIFALRENKAGRRFDGVITAEGHNARRFPPHKTITVHNYPIIGELESLYALPYRERSNVIIYIGALTRVRGLFEMIGAIEGLSDDYRAKLALGGSFHPSSLRAEVEPRFSSVDYLGYIERSQVADVLGRSRIGLAVLHPVEKYLEAYPTKMFEYMAAGLPVIVSDFPMWREIVEDAGCGFVVDPLDVDVLREKVMWLLDHPGEAEAMGERGREAVEAKYSWEPEGKRLLRFYERLLAGQPPGEPS